MNRTDTFTVEEWHTLLFAPLWAFAALAGRYRAFDPLDLEAFTHAVEQAADAERGRLGGHLLGRVALDLDRLTHRFENDDRSVASGLWQVSLLLTRLPAEEADAFRDALVSGVCEGVARARGRYGRIISEEDAKIVELVAALLA
jgi:hypothetical protein